MGLQAAGSLKFAIEGVYHRSNWIELVAAKQDRLIQAESTLRCRKPSVAQVNAPQQTTEQGFEMRGDVPRHGSHLDYADGLRAEAQDPTD